MAAGGNSWLHAIFAYILPVTSSLAIFQDLYSKIILMSQISDGDKFALFYLAVAKFINEKQQVYQRSEKVLVDSVQQLRDKLPKRPYKLTSDWAVMMSVTEFWIKEKPDPEDDATKHIMDVIMKIVSWMYPNSNSLSAKIMALRKLFTSGSRELHEESLMHIRHSKELLTVRFREQREHLQARHLDPLVVEGKDIEKFLETVASRFHRKIANFEELATAIGLATGARPIEILLLSNFIAAGTESITLQGIAKKFQQDTNTRLVFRSTRACFGLPPRLILEFVKELRTRVRAILEERHLMGGFTEAFKQEKFACEHLDFSELTIDDEPDNNVLQQIIKKLNYIYSTRIEKLFSLGKKFRLKDCRPIYAAISYEKIGKPRRITKMLWISENLGHGAMTTALHYEPVVIV